MVRGKPFEKGHKKLENSGRGPGVKNHRTIFIKTLLEDAVVKIGGLERLVAWAKKSPENEHAFWTELVPRLIPIQLQTSGTTELVITVKHEELAQKLIEHGLPPAVFNVDIPKLEDMREVIDSNGANGNGNGESTE